jgi:hypothetical protein
MTDLQHRLHHALDEQHLDLIALTARAQRQGTHLRWRRRAASVTGSVALAAVLGVGITSATGLPGPGQDRPATPPAGYAAGSGPSVGELSEETSPATARSVTAALQAAVSDVADGTASGFSGHLSYAESAQTYQPLDDSPTRDGYEGSLTFTPANGSAGAVVRASVGDKGELDYNKRTAEENFVECTSAEKDCLVKTLSDGSLLKTFEVRGIASNGGNQDALMLVATRLVGDAVVSVFATNHKAGLTVAGSEVTRTDAVLSLEQLTEIVSQPWWGYELPREFAEAGEALPGYEESDSVVD